MPERPRLVLAILFRTLSAFTLLAIAVACARDEAQPRSAPSSPAGAGSSVAATARNLSDQLPFRLLDWPVSIARPTYSPDGQHIAFASKVADTYDLYTVEVATDQVRQLTSGPWDESRPAWSPDGTRLVFQSSREGRTGLWILDLEDGSIERLTPEEQSAGTPHWSPRGDLIAFASDFHGNVDIWVIRPDGSGARAVTRHEGNEYHPSFSPDGDSITFYPTWHGWTDIATVSIDDGVVKELLSGEDEDFRPAYSPDGRWIAFASDRQGTSGLWVVPSAGGTPRQILTAEHGLDYPDWRPDGKAMLYLEEEVISSLERLDLERTQRRSLTPGGLSTLDRNPDVSPDGRMLVYESNRYGNEGNVVLFDLETSEEHRLTSGRINDGAPRFSADGERLIYVTSGGDQADSQAVVHDLERADSRLWSDRKNIAYPAFCGSDAIVFGWAKIAYTTEVELWLSTAGGERRVGDFLIERAGLDCPPGGEWAVASLRPSGSPGDGLPPRLVRIDLPSGRLTKLTEGTGPHLHPRISPDRSKIAFIAATETGWAAQAIPITGGEPIELMPPSPELTLVDWLGTDELIYSLHRRVDRARLIATDWLE